MCIRDSFSGILTRGGTILGTSRTPFKRLDIPEADGVDKVAAMKGTYRELGGGHLTESLVDEALIAIFETEDLDRLSRAMVESLSLIHIW